MKVSQKEFPKWLQFWTFTRIDGNTVKETIVCDDPQCKLRGCPEGNARLVNNILTPCTREISYYPCANPFYEVWVYRISNRIQKLLWLMGISIHNVYAGECTPNFSCCANIKDNPILRAIVEAAEKGEPIVRIQKLPKEKAN